MDLLAGVAGWLTDPVHWQGPAGVPARVGEHLALSAAALAIAAALGLVAGAWVGHTGRGTTLVANIANVGRALPTLAVMGLVVPVTAAIDNQAGFFVYPIVVALVVLAIPPLLINAYAGIGGVDRDVVEAGRAAGMRDWEVLWRLELPLATPVILTGVRSAAAQVVATATLAAVFGGPGLGRYLVEGYAQLDYPMMWAGVILVGALFALVEVGLALVQRILTSPGLHLARRSAAA
jgi:osmoprotectant transport system permease protein